MQTQCGKDEAGAYITLGVRPEAEGDRLASGRERSMTQAVIPIQACIAEDRGWEECEVSNSCSTSVLCAIWVVRRMIFASSVS